MAPSRTDGRERCAAKIPSQPVRFGSKADINAVLIDVCFTPKSGRRFGLSGCLLCAKSRHYALQQEIRCVEPDFSCRPLEFERGKRLLRNLWRPYKNTLRSTSHLYATTITFYVAPLDFWCLIMRSEYDFESAVEENEDEAAWPKSPEEFIDRFGIRTALFVLCIASFLAAI